jgi:hypothetical protein
MTATTLLFAATALSATAMVSIGFAVHSLHEDRARSFQMLPLALQPGSPPGFASRLFNISLVAALGLSLVAVVAIGYTFSVWAAIIGAVVLFLIPGASQGWWIRDSSRRPLLPYLLFAMLTLALAVAASVAMIFSN